MSRGALIRGNRSPDRRGSCSEGPVEDPTTCRHVLSAFLILYPEKLRAKHLIFKPS